MRGREVDCIKDQNVNIKKYCKRFGVSQIKYLILKLSRPIGLSGYSIL